MAAKHRKTKNTKPTRRRWHFLIYLAIALLTVAVYWQVARFEFTNYDDDVYVTENVMVQRGLSLQTVAWAFTTDEACNWHPLTWISHLLDVRLYGADPAGHHITSLILHLAGALLLFAALSRMTGSVWRSAFVALLFAIHPLHVESVAWVAERKDVLSSLFWMLAMLAYVGYARHPRAKSYLLLLLALAAGLMSKPMLVSLPIVLILLDYWPLERPALYGWKRLVVEKLPLFALVAASSTVTFWAQASGGAVRALQALPFGIRLANAVVCYAAYIAKMFWPARLAVYYPHPNSALPAWQVIGSTALLALITAAVIRLRKRAPYALVGWLWYLITLVPVIGLVQVGDQAMADRYSYIPLIGLFIIIAWGVPDALASTKAASPKALVPMAAIVVLALMICTHQQVGYWRNSFALWGRALSVTRFNAIADSNLAHALAKRGDLNEATFHFQRAIGLRPNYAVARYGLGYVLAQESRFKEAIAEFRLAVRLCPERADFHGNLGIALAKVGRPREALAELKKAVHLDPERAEHLSNLGNFFMENGQCNRAIRYFREAASLDPANPTIRQNLQEAIRKQESRQ